MPYKTAHSAANSHVVGDGGLFKKKGALLLLKKMRTQSVKQSRAQFKPHALYSKVKNLNCNTKFNQTKFGALKVQVSADKFQNFKVKFTYLVQI